MSSSTAAECKRFQFEIFYRTTSFSARLVILGSFPHYLKTHQMFSVHTTPEKFEKRNKHQYHFGFVFEGNSVSEIPLLS